MVRSVVWSTSGLIGLTVWPSGVGVDIAHSFDEAPRPTQTSVEQGLIEALLPEQDTREQSDVTIEAPTEGEPVLPAVVRLSPGRAAPAGVTWVYGVRIRTSRLLGREPAIGGVTCVRPV